MATLWLRRQNRNLAPITADELAAVRATPGVEIKDESFVSMGAVAIEGELNILRGLVERLTGYELAPTAPMSTPRVRDPASLAQRAPRRQ